MLKINHCITLNVGKQRFNLKSKGSSKSHGEGAECHASKLQATPGSIPTNHIYHYGPNCIVMTSGRPESFECDFEPRSRESVLYIEHVEWLEDEFIGIRLSLSSFFNGHIGLHVLA